MRKCMEEVASLLKAGIDCIWIKTYEEDAAINDIKEIVQGSYPSFPVYIWSNTEGARRAKIHAMEKELPPAPKLAEVQALFQKLVFPKAGVYGEEDSSSCFFILRDIHELVMSNGKLRRFIRDLKEPMAKKQFVPLIVIAPHAELPDEISRLFRVVEYSLPDKMEIGQYIDQATESLKSLNESKPDDGYEPPAPDERQKIMDACAGLTTKEIVMCISESMMKLKRIDPAFLMENKIQEVKKSGVLDYRMPRATLDDIGGNRAIKKWLQEVKDAFSPEAREFGLAMPKGFMAVGVPGCAKTMVAEAFAGMLGLPLLEFSIGKIMSKLVGESEKRIDAALQLVRACAPCVLLLDEAEKLLGGAGYASNRVDGGITNRVMQSMLKFMDGNDHGVYIIMTSNDVSQLPPEFTRSGRIDATWYFGLPGEEERKEIFRIHFEKSGRNASDSLVSLGAKSTEGYTGAEIAEVVRNCMRKAFHRMKSGGTSDFLDEDMEDSVSEVIPVSRSSKEKIAALEMYCADRARRTDEMPKKADEKQPAIFNMIKF